MCGALRSMGADAQERPDGLVVRHSHLRGAALDSRCDHRIVMTLAVAGLIADGRTIIRDTDCVKKTFGDFAHQMRSLGAEIEPA